MNKTELMLNQRDTLRATLRSVKRVRNEAPEKIRDEVMRITELLKDVITHLSIEIEDQAESA